MSSFFEERFSGGFASVVNSNDHCYLVTKLDDDDGNTFVAVNNLHLDAICIGLAQVLINIYGGGEGVSTCSTCVLWSRESHAEHEREGDETLFEQFFHVV